jgi:hypothetical protein
VLTGIFKQKKYKRKELQKKGKGRSRIKKKGWR